MSFGVNRSIPMCELIFFGATASWELFNSTAAGSGCALHALHAKLLLSITNYHQRHEYVLEFAVGSFFMTSMT